MFLSVSACRRCRQALIYGGERDGRRGPAALRIAVARTGRFSTAALEGHPASDRSVLPPDLEVIPGTDDTIRPVSATGPPKIEPVTMATRCAALLTEKI